MSDQTEVLSRRLTEQLIGEGRISERWAAAMCAVPRHQYIPDAIYLHEDHRGGNDLRPLHRQTHPDRWLDLVYSDTSINTQVDDGHPDQDGAGREITSSSSQPTVVAEMLAELGPQPGDRVLEIGAGTGWNAALLAHEVGPEQITTIEIDPSVAAGARAALDTNGYGAVTLIVGDGAAGWPDRAPYDRVIGTAGVTAIPYAWVKQTVPGGRIVAPIRNTYQPPGIAVLTRHHDGTATGRLAGPAAFMALRAQREHRIRSTEFPDPPELKSTTDLHPSHVAGNRHAATAIGLQLPGVRWVWQPAGNLGTLWLYARASRSWASVNLLETPPYPVEQAGPRRLAEEVEEAYRWWQQAGEPKISDWLITVDRHGQRIELNEQPEHGPQGAEQLRDQHHGPWLDS